MPLGQDDMGGSGANRVTASEADTVGSSSGAETHALSVEELASHSHYVSIVKNVGSGGSEASANADSHNSTNATGSTGSGTAHNNMPPYLTINFAIKT
jgi:microcystin-dependent protein